MWNYNYGYGARNAPPDPAEQLKQLRQKNPYIQPVVVRGGGKLAKTWWGQAWNKNLETYADYESRIGRGRSYVKKGAVADLSIESGQVRALVLGSCDEPYTITVAIKPLAQRKWKSIVTQCSHSIGNLKELAAGTFPQELMELFTSKGDGLFPSPREISFDCSCPDWASMCKHVAAVLYGIGVRFDADPTLFFLLRNIDFSELLKKSVEEKMKSLLKNAGKKTPRVMSNVDTNELFGV